MKNEKDDIQKELEELSPLLARMKEREEQPFQVPDHYFRQLTQQVMEQVKLQPQPVSSKRPAGVPAWFGRMREWFAPAPRLIAGLATVAILLVAGLYWLDTVTNEHTERLVSELTTEDLDNYVAANLDDFELDLLIELAALESEEPAVPTEEEELDQYLDEIIDEMDLEELEDIF